MTDYPEGTEYKFTAAPNRTRIASIRIIETLVEKDYRTTPMTVTRGPTTDYGAKAIVMASDLPPLGANQKIAVVYNAAKDRFDQVSPAAKRTRVSEHWPKRYTRTKRDKSE